MTFIPAPQDEALVRAVLEAPDDDAPRLVYADRLMERGEVALGELIVLQCRRDPRADELLSANLARWIAGFRDRAGWAVEVERGFVSAVWNASCESLRANAAALAWHPLRRIGIGSALLAEIAALLDEPFAARLEMLRMQTNISIDLDVPATRAALAGLPEGLLSLGVTLPHTPLADAMRGLVLPRCTLEMLDVVMSTPPPRLERLSFDATHLAHSGLEHACLRELVLWNVSEAVASAVARSEQLPRLRRLQLQGARGDGHGPRLSTALAEGLLLRQLEHLTTSAPLNALLAHAIAERAKALESLVLTTPVSAALLAPLLASELPSRLHELTLSTVDSVPIRAFTLAPFQRLRRLELRGFFVDEADARVFAEGPAFASLEELEVTHMTDGAAPILAQRWPDYAR